MSANARIGMRERVAMGTKGTGWSIRPLKGAKPFFETIGILFALGLFVYPLPAGSSVGLDPHDPVLRLKEHPEAPTLDRWNFTTFPPESPEHETRRASQDADPTFQAHWVWYLMRAPETWSIPAGTQWEFVLHVDGFDETLPLPGDPLDPTDSPGRHGVEVEITTGERVHASGRLDLGLLTAHEGVRVVEVPVTFHEAQTFTPGNGPGHLRIDISVSGRGLGEESPLRLYYDGSEHPSSLNAPGYPVQAFRSLEQGP